MKSRLLFLPFISVLIFACHSTKNVSGTIKHKEPEYKAYKIDTSYKQDVTVARFIEPYSLQVNKQMNVVIGETETRLVRSTPEGTLGNFVTNAMLQQAKASYNKTIDASFVNDGGLRVSEIAQGPITLGKIYELMPFDNILVLLKMNGSQLLQLVDFIASKRGWPVANIKMQIKNGRAINPLINGRAIDTDASYNILTTDYTANGNEGADFLKGIKQENNGYLLRDALIDYVKAETRGGRKIKAQIENRVTNAE